MSCPRSCNCKRPYIKALAALLGRDQGEALLLCGMLLPQLWSLAIPQAAWKENMRQGWISCLRSLWPMPWQPQAVLSSCTMCLARSCLLLSKGKLSPPEDILLAEMSPPWPSCLYLELMHTTIRSMLEASPSHTCISIKRFLNTSRRKTILTPISLLGTLRRSMVGALTQGVQQDRAICSQCCSACDRDIQAAKCAPEWGAVTAVRPPAVDTPHGRSPAYQVSPHSSCSYPKSPSTKRPSWPAQEGRRSAMHC